ncbi:hypothetical protein DPMN_068310 [Dreissena polymorpha]|uniref:Uncharacterized protein n=1 Tax=Dreissena polymorpha TaxID=45954 RepID=A0A9D3Z0Y2_DREPO|nr:hypothetical protein DPMN_068310 [Dreissena polymorpha]
MLRSSNIGQHYSVLHDSELNIGSSNTTVAGALMYASERTVSWYLMKIQYVPDNCETDVNCIVRYDTDSGYVEFSTHDISLNQIYYICAHSNTTEVNRELFTEALQEISSCSNGFVLDSSPPTKGHVQVQNHKGFVTNPQHVLVTWDGFDENIDASIFGYPSKLLTFSVAIGTNYRFDFPTVYFAKIYWKI